MRKWREMLRPGWVARLKLVIIASDASSSELAMKHGSSSEARADSLFPGCRHFDSKLEFGV